MGIDRRRVRWALALASVVLVGLGVWFYRFYFGSTDAAIRHAEAFLFRRMSVSQLAEQGLYRFFFATNRVMEPGEGGPLQRFGNERSETLSFGSFDAEIKPSLGLGMLINPTAWLQNEEIKLRDTRILPREQFLAALRDTAEASPHGAVLVVLHGFREAYESALRKTAFLGHVLDIDTPVLLFDWPGDQGSSLRGYRRARAVATDSGAELAKTLELVIREVRPRQLWVMANSMGAQVVVDAFGLLHQDAGGRGVLGADARTMRCER